MTPDREREEPSEPSADTKSQLNEVRPPLPVEIAMYHGLITKGEAMGQDEVVALLRENLEQEQRVLQLAEQQTQQLSQQLATQIASGITGRRPSPLRRRRYADFASSASARRA